MRKSRFTEAQIIGMIKEPAAARPLELGVGSPVVSAGGLVL